MNRILIPAVLVSLAVAMAESAHADNWMFRRSYHSHAPLPNQPGVPPANPIVRRDTAYRPAIRGGSFGFGARGAIRWNYIRLWGGGPSWDTTLQWEHYFQSRP